MRDENVKKASLRSTNSCLDDPNSPLIIAVMESTMTVFIRPLASDALNNHWGFTIDQNAHDTALIVTP